MQIVMNPSKTLCVTIGVRLFFNLEKVRFEPVPSRSALRASKGTKIEKPVNVRGKSRVNDLAYFRNPHLQPERLEEFECPFLDYLQKT
jgi:hypothetical protein